MSRCPWPGIAHGVPLDACKVGCLSDVRRSALFSSSMLSSAGLPEFSPTQKGRSKAISVRNLCVILIPGRHSCLSKAQGVSVL